MSEPENIQLDEANIDTKLIEEKPVEEGSRKISKPTEKFLALVAELDKTPEPENKLRQTLSFMETALSQENGVPHFKNFWDARDICLKLFKEGLSHPAREVFWGRYSELSREARRLKDILDEQSAFAVEQIEIAIKALENEIVGMKAQMDGQNPIEFAITNPIFTARLSFYQNNQKELNLLNTYAARINALRKELIKTDMRVRHKNKFFQRLSAAGDHVFPRRKDLISQISDAFTNDTEQFMSATFKDGIPGEPSFVLRDEIKALQAMAKTLTLNTNAFTSTRMKLSEAWDKVKEVAKERKKARLEQKAELRQNAENIRCKILECAKAFTEGSINMDEANRQLEAINNEMRDVRLGRDEVKVLRDELKIARGPLNEKLKEESKRREDEQRQVEIQRQEKFDGYKDSIRQLIDESDKYDMDGLIAKRKELRQTIQDSDFHKAEKRELEMLLKPLADIIQDKKEQALMNLSDDDQKALGQLKEVLDQRLKRRQEIKEQLEIFRKEAGSSGLGFEQAMAYNEQINIEKERLEKINHGIQEIEDKIEELESQVY